MKVEPIEKIMINSISIFKSMGPFQESDKLKKALIVVFPNLPDKKTSVLDKAHENIKTSFITEGLMVGQFHKNCQERGIYNPTFRVSISPYPLIAIRYMAIHDIIFIKSNSVDWFNSYNIRFGHKFNEPEKLEDYEKPFLSHYVDAKKRFIK
jgi:hypothetical protein